MCNITPSTVQQIYILMASLVFPWHFWRLSWWWWSSSSSRASCPLSFRLNFKLSNVGLMFYTKSSFFKFSTVWWVVHKSTLTWVTSDAHQWENSFPIFGWSVRKPSQSILPLSYSGFPSLLDLPLNNSWCIRYFPVSLFFRRLRRCRWWCARWWWCRQVITVCRLARLSRVVVVGPLQIQSTLETHRINRSRETAPETSTETFFVNDNNDFFFSQMQPAVEIRDSADAQSVEFRPQERPMLLPRFFGKERLSFAKSDSRRGPSSSRMSDSPSLREVEQAASGFALGLTCKYLLLPHFPCSLSGRLADRVATEETQKKAARSQLEEKAWKRHWKEEKKLQWLQKIISWAKFSSENNE